MQEEKNGNMKKVSPVASWVSDVLLVQMPFIKKVK
jgi:hypothetical protein